MTDLRGDDAADLPGGRPRWSLTVGLNVVGIVVVAFWLVVNGTRGHYAPAVFVLGGVALAAWAVRETGRSRRTAILASGVMVAAGAAAVVGSDTLLVVPVIIGLVLLQAALELPVWVGTVAALVAAVEIGVGAMLVAAAPGTTLGSLAGLVLGVLIGVSRRQARAVAAQRRRAEDEERRSDLLADRARAARDVHDVLAHSLGGLVLQLDAVEALLEADRVDDAASRVSDARRLAADGLAEARRAVAALRGDPTARPAEPSRAAGPAAGSSRATAPVAAADVADASRASRSDAEPAAPPTLDALVDAHRTFGGVLTVDGETTLPGLDARHVATVVASCREALANARRHAPGRPVSLSVTRDGDAVTVAVANPLPTAGHGLVGMRERFAELADTSSIAVGPAGDEFVVRMRLPLETPVGKDPS